MLVCLLNERAVICRHVKIILYCCNTSLDLIFYAVSSMKDHSDKMSSEIYWREEKQMGNFIFVFPEANMQHIHQRNKTICTICGDLCILFYFLYMYTLS